MKYYMSNMLLIDTDVSSMAHGLVIRVPFLHQPFVERVLALPSSMRFPNGKPKDLLRKILVGILPDDVLARAKQGFGLSIARWLLGPCSTWFEEGIERLRESQVLKGSGIDIILRRYPLKLVSLWSRPFALSVLGWWLARRSGEF